MENLIDPIQDVERELEYRVMNSSKVINDFQDCFDVQEIPDQVEQESEKDQQIDLLPNTEQDTIKQEFNK